MVGKVWPTADAVDQKDVSVPATDEEMAAFSYLQNDCSGWQTEDAWPLEHFDGRENQTAHRTG